MPVTSQSVKEFRCASPLQAPRQLPAVGRFGHDFHEVLLRQLMAGTQEWQPCPSMLPGEGARQCPEKEDRETGRHGDSKSNQMVGSAIAGNAWLLAKARAPRALSLWCRTPRCCPTLSPDPRGCSGSHPWRMVAQANVLMFQTA